MIEADEDIIPEEEVDENERRLSNYPSRRIGHIAVKHNNRILVWGGYKVQKDSINGAPRYLSATKLWLYDSLVEKWQFLRTSKVNAPARVSGSCALIHDDTLYIFGGFCGGVISRDLHTNSISALNLNTLQWQSFDCHGCKPLACDKMVGWVHEGRLYFFGGFGVSPYSADFKKKCDFCYDSTSASFKCWNNQLVMFDPKVQTWSWPLFEGPVPTPRAAHAAAKVGNNIFIFGGRHQAERMNDMHCLDLKLMKWSGRLSTTGSIPTGRSWHSFTPISSSHIVLYGGFSSQQEALSKCCDCWMFYIPTLTWTKVSLPYNKPRLWHTACEADQGEIIIFGGCVGNILNPAIPAKTEDIITIWFSPKSLLRICLDYNAKHKQHFQHQWSMLPLGLQALLKLKCSRVSIRGME